MKNNSICIWAIFAFLCCLQACKSIGEPTSTQWVWESVEANGAPTARHEAAAIDFDGKIYLLGGRRINPVDVFDPETKTWTQKSKTPLELHHFQAVVVDDAIYILGAMTGGWPTEKPLDRILIYYPKTDTYEWGAEIPKDRRRGGAGAVYRDGKIYLVGGITNGHLDGYVNWFDSYDVKTKQWTVLPDAPHRRDHFQAVTAGNKLYAFAGRRSEQRANLPFEQTVYAGDVFNFDLQTWEEGSAKTNIPTRRAGNFAIASGDYVIVGGGESSEQVQAHNEVEVFDARSKSWSSWPNMLQGRHGTGFAIVDGYLYTVSGCGHRGGSPELTTIERLKLPEDAIAHTLAPQKKVLSSNIEETVVLDKSPKLWHTVTLDFLGPETSETASFNPFTDYRLLVEFSNGDTTFLIRGFYAADGDAANTSAKSGNIWQARFTPNKEGQWTYKARFTMGDNIAVSRDIDEGKQIPLKNSAGQFQVLPSNAQGIDFRTQRRGFLKSEGKVFRFSESGDYWLKGGANSPENMLGYVDFDDTYRLVQESREGEASTVGGIHTFQPHLQDWKAGDPVWGRKSGEAKGHALIGAMNYLAKQGMNAVYFLTFNVTGDGNDVWPYESPDEFDRFDVSKLEQWNVLFDHMQSKGILLHMVTQERENELLLDGGNTEFERSLYYAELISRFGHHPALVWNLGEENGPASWDPQGQNDQQRKAMAQFFADNDPYDHTVLLHSHAAASDIEKIFTPLLGFEPLDGISLQVHGVEDASSTTKQWHKLSQEAGHQWLLSLDELGTWYTGALPDDIDPDHDEIRRHVLWGHLLAGGAGVEWYFGGKYHSNDVTAEDWRTRHNLWKQTRIATSFFEEHIQYWRLLPCDGIVSRADTYCGAVEDETYVFYMPGRGSTMVYLDDDAGKYAVSWLDPKAGGDLQKGSVEIMQGGGDSFVGFPPNTNTQDWVVLLEKISN